MTISDKDLINAAKDARGNAYSHYSGYAVGAAIIDDQGNLHVGVNIENVAYPLGNCAEASAISAMVLKGGKNIVRMAIAGGKGEIAPCMPCGGCRQRIYEFANEETVIITMNDSHNWQNYSITELLPVGFDKSSLAN
ncbi:MAG: cytidine deaminase [Woeseiaceae bacterium]|jgi:cytidine deaminase|nr:cytidine deaminase [Woeseiaceae bacterium]